MNRFCIYMPLFIITVTNTKDPLYGDYTAHRRTLVTWQASQGRARTNDSSPWKMLHLKEMYKQIRLFNIWDALYFTLNVQTDSVQVKLYLIIEPYFVYFYMLHEFNLPWHRVWMGLTVNWETAKKLTVIWEFRVFLG